MAIDVRVSRQDMNTRNKYYKGEYVDDMSLVKDAKVQGVFYSMDVEPMSEQRISMGNVMVKQYKVVIVTYDTVNDLEPDDYVLYDGELFLVESVVRDDETKNKEFNKRPVLKTIIRLRR